MATLRATQKALTRQLLLAAALELFEAGGYGSTTIDEIATKAGTTRVTFYAHFASRTDLMRALINEKLNEEVHRARSPERGSTAPELVEIIREGSQSKIAEWIRERSARWPTVASIFRVAHEAAVVDPELSTLVDGWLEEAVADVEEGLAQAGRFDPASRRYRASLALAQLDYTVLHWHLPTRKLNGDQMIEIVARSWMALLVDP